MAGHTTCLTLRPIISYTVQDSPDSQVDDPAESERETRQQTTARLPQRLSDRVEDLVAIYVSGELVMVVVTELPRVVGHHEKAVRHGADDVVQQRVAREWPVTAVVSGDEQSEEERTLYEPVEADEEGSQHEWLGQWFDQRQGGVDGNHLQKKITRESERSLGTVHMLLNLCEMYCRQVAMK